MWAVLLVAIYGVLINAKEPIYYLDFEHPNCTYFNPKYYEYVNITAQRYNRRDIIHYVNIHFKSYTVIGNDVKVDASVYEFLSNEYRRSMVEMHFGLCETFVATKYHMFLPFYAKYFNASSCPFPMGEYHFTNMSIPNVPLLATFPFRKGRLYVALSRSAERLAEVYIDAVIKQRFN